MKTVIDMVNYQDKLDWVHLGDVTKTNDKLVWPTFDRVDAAKLNKSFKQGVYLILQKNTDGIKVRKVGCYGEGNTKGVCRRFGHYRNTNNYLSEITLGIKGKNGSYRTCMVLQEKLKEGEKVAIVTAALPDDYLGEDGFPRKVDLYAIEKNIKENNEKDVWLI